MRWTCRLEWKGTSKTKLSSVRAAHLFPIFFVEFSFCVSYHFLNLHFWGRFYDQNLQIYFLTSIYLRKILLKKSTRVTSFPFGVENFKISIFIPEKHFWGWMICLKLYEYRNCPHERIDETLSYRGCHKKFIAWTYQILHWAWCRCKLLI